MAKTQGKGREVVFLSGVRTRGGPFGGSLKGKSVMDLAVTVARCVVACSGLEPEAAAIRLREPKTRRPVPFRSHLLHALRRSGGRFGIGSACISGDRGAAVMMEAFAK